ncbi:MAG: hypothetical protein ABI847_08260 [Anaerolineales bacterium]
MADADLRTQLIGLLTETGRAHHRAYRATHGADAEWPIWYAEYMQARLNGMIGAVCTRSELVYLLVLVEKERAGRAPQAGWAGYYADFFMERYGAMQGQMPPEPAGDGGSQNEDKQKP